MLILFDCVMSTNNYDKSLKFIALIRKGTIIHIIPFMAYYCYPALKSSANKKNFLKYDNNCIAKKSY